MSSRRYLWPTKGNVNTRRYHYQEHTVVVAPVFQLYTWNTFRPNKPAQTTRTAKVSPNRYFISRRQWEPIECEVVADCLDGYCCLKWFEVEYYSTRYLTILVARNA